MKWAGVRTIVGYARPGRSLLLDEAVEPLTRQRDQDWVAREEHVLGLMRFLGCPDLGTELSLPTVHENPAELEQFFEGMGLPADDTPWVVLAPGASYGSSKRWPTSHFAEVGDALVGAGARVLLVGTSEESPLTRAVKNAMRSPALDLGGRLDLTALKVVIERSRVLVANDAGCRHIAAAFGIPSLIFFGSTTTEKTPLNLEAVEVFERSLECRPCYKRVCPRAGHPCLSGIMPAAVSEVALETLLKQAPSESEPRLA